MRIGGGGNAALIVLGIGAMAACGGGSSSTPPTGAGADAPPADADAAPGTTHVWVDVRAEGGSGANWRVLLHDAEGSLIGETATGSNGRASISPAPSQVTAISPRGTVLMTFTNVADRDVLSILDDDALPRQPHVARYAVTLPGPFEGATRYSALIGGCIERAASTTDPTLPLSIYGSSDCALKADTVLAVAADGMSTKAFAWRTGLAPAGETLVPVTTGSWSPAKQTTFGLEPAPSPAMKNRSMLLWATPEGTDPVLLTWLVGTDRMTVAVPQGFADAFAAVFIIRGNLGTSDESRIVRSRAEGPFLIDPAEALPFATALSLLPTDGGRYEATWNDGGSRVKSGSTVTLRLGTTTPLRMGSWTFIVPPGTTRIRTPVMPKEAFAWSGPPVSLAGVATLDSDAVPTFDEMRTTPTPTNGFGAFHRPLAAKDGARLRSVITSSTDPSP